MTVAPVFLLGESSVEYGKKKRRYLPYNHQHLYFFLSEYLLALWGGNVAGLTPQPMLPT